MKKWHPLAALGAIAAIPALAAGCEPEPLSQLVVVITTDMAPPKDFDILRVEVFNEGALKFQFEGPIPGNPDEKTRIVLPGTLGLLGSDDASDAIRIEVGVRNGASGPVRVVREAVTTIPQERVAMLSMPIQFLCKKDDIPFDNDDKLQSECGEGKTCIAGRCEDSYVDSSTLPDWDAARVFGGSKDPTKGVCFDVQTCFSEAELIDTTKLDLASCSFEARRPRGGRLRRPVPRGQRARGARALGRPDDHAGGRARAVQRPRDRDRHGDRRRAARAEARGHDRAGAAPPGAEAHRDREGAPRIDACSDARPDAGAHPDRDAKEEPA